VISSAFHPEPTNSKPGAVHAITQPFGHEGFVQALIKLYDIKKVGQTMPSLLTILNIG
jgi:hypothetical protein